MHTCVHVVYMYRKQVYDMPSRYMHIELVHVYVYTVVHRAHSLTHYTILYSTAVVPQPVTDATTLLEIRYV